MTDATSLAQFVQQTRVARGVTWSDASRVSVARKYVCISVPKVACSTLKLAVHTFEDPENEIEWWQTHDDWVGWRALDFSDDVAIEMLSSPDWFRFCFVRNPYDRLVSAWKSKLVTDRDAGYQWLRDAIRESFKYPVVDGQRTGGISFRDAFDYVTGDDPVAQRDPHWMPQSALLHADLIPYDVVGRFETFAADFRRIFNRLGAPSNVLAMADTRYNATYDSEWRDLYDADLAERVHAFYAEDFRAFDYGRESWIGGAEL